MNRKTLVSLLVGLALATAAVALEPEHQETRDLRDPDGKPIGRLRGRVNARASRLPFVNE